MPAIEVGRICVKIAGREAGKKCVIVEVVDKNFVVITGPKKVNNVKRRKVNIKHVEPTEDKLKITKTTTDEEIMEALKKADKLEEMAKPVKIPA